jgi:hypothetical protein
MEKIKELESRIDKIIGYLIIISIMIPVGFYLYWGNMNDRVERLESSIHYTNRQLDEVNRKLHRIDEKNSLIAAKLTLLMMEQREGE